MTSFYFVNSFNNYLLLLRLSFYINNDFSSNSNPNLVFIYPIINYNSLGYEEAKFNYLNNSQLSCF